MAKPFRVLTGRRKEPQTNPIENVKRKYRGQTAGSGLNWPSRSKVIEIVRFMFALEAPEADEGQ
jgi:hypothetical protein